MSHDNVVMSPLLQRNAEVSILHAGVTHHDNEKWTTRLSAPSCGKLLALVQKITYCEYEHLHAKYKGMQFITRCQIIWMDGWT
jgi:hypothetical protein